MFSISLVTIDSYQASPLSNLDVTFSDFRGTEITRVPVLRIFGSTTTGQKTCLHVHGVFPYIYVPCTVEENASHYAYKLAAALDNAINVSFGSTKSNHQHVFKIQLVSGIPLYGYHENEYKFFKIYFYNPAMIKRAADLLQNGAVSGQSLQPYEAHIPFILQFMIDYNLYGMSIINLRCVKYRHNTHCGLKEIQKDKDFSLQDESQKYLPITITKQSICELEVDAQASDILNHKAITKGLESNPGLAAVWKEEKARRLVAGLQDTQSQILCADTPDRPAFHPTNNDVYQMNRLKQRLLMISQGDETRSSSNTNVSTYPVELQNDNGLINASYISNHIELSCLSNRIVHRSQEYNEERELTSINVLDEAQSKNDSLFLDTEDMQLVEMLTKLAAGNEEDEIVDDDSMLGSQYSVLNPELIKSDNEENEADNLNITSLDLDSMDSWQSYGTDIHLKKVDHETSSKTSKNADIKIKEIKPNALSNLPQYDGASDTIIRPHNTKRKKFAYDSTKGEKGSCNPEVISNDRHNKYIFHKHCLDHKDLDIYDVNEIENLDNLSNVVHVKNSIRGSTRSALDKLNTYFFEMSYKRRLLDECEIILPIPALDGDTNDNFSDTDYESDVTIEKHEKRICTYSYNKQFNQQHVINITPKKRKNRFDHDESPSIAKRRHTVSKIAQSSLYNVPAKSKVSTSSQCSLRNYSPLNIMLTSPKIPNSLLQLNNTIGTELMSAKVHVDCATPKSKKSLTLNRRPKSLMTIFGHNISENDNTEGSEENQQVDDTTKIQSPVSSDSIKEIDSVDYKEEIRNSKMKCGPTSSAKSSMEVRKRLIFSTISGGREITETDNQQSTSQISIASDIDENQMERNKQMRCIDESDIEDTDLNNTLCNIKCSSDVSQDKVDNFDSDSVNGENVRTNGERRNQTSSIQYQNIVNLRHLGIDESDETETICDETFTQHINDKINILNQSLSLDHKMEDKHAILITTKFNPPNRERILESMNMYSILQCKHQKPFLSNRADTHNSNKNILMFKSSIENVTSIKLWRRMKVNEFHPSGTSIKSTCMKRALASYILLTISPLRQPPTPKNVQSWLRAKKYLLKKGGSDTDNKIIIENNYDAAFDQHRIINLKGRNVEENHDKQCDKTKDCTLLADTFLQKSVSTTGTMLKDTGVSKSQKLYTTSSTLDPSLQKALENPLLHEKNESAHRLGMSYGEIDYSSKSGSDTTDNNIQSVRAFTMHQYLTLIALEIHVTTHGDLLPNPGCNPIEAVFYAIQNDVPVTCRINQMEYGAIMVNPFVDDKRQKHRLTSSTTCSISYVNNEIELLESLVALISKHDPDILLGWELETLSWGYISQRASNIGITNFLSKISRIPTIKLSQETEKDEFNEMKVPGRIVLNIWRIMRHEAALLNYTFENVMYNILHERIPCPDFKTLSNWWKSTEVMKCCRVIEHYIVRVLGTLKILAHLDIIGRTSEHARLFGIQLYEVFSRGSQFRVESMMLRLAKPQNYIPLSPSVQQRARMRAPEALPLIMEPESMFYTDPLIVLDFQSLYPSIIIAYNYCFSTCLGRIEHIGQNDPFEFGAGTLRVTKSTISKLDDKLNFAPCGVAFVNREIREGILPRMLMEILNTRLMVKESMKLHSPENRVLQRVLHSQQLGLKLIANVTYGYTAANFSGRMPCIEVGDSVVSKGRETLERAIKIVESTPKWGAQVVYGDTDSLFILLPGKSRLEAFDIGNEIADTVTKANPPPIKLKFEKVLHPCILQTKKRYCGYMYECVNQEKPEYLAKGIETVRRDGCPAVAKILEKTLKILFETKDISLIKQYVVRQLDKVLRKRVSIQDLTFAKEFRGLNGYKSNACVPALELTRRLMRRDPRAVPRAGERVRYVIVAGAPNESLIRCVRTPQEVLYNSGLCINSIYYITKVIIPPLNRCLSLIGIDVHAWYKEMSHGQIFDKAFRFDTNGQKATIREFFNVGLCAVCGEQTNTEICYTCKARSDHVVFMLTEKLRGLERAYYQSNAVCQSCVGRSNDFECITLDCPILYRVIRTRKELTQISFLQNIINNVETIS